jgi:hypothetical protein
MTATSTAPAPTIQEKLVYVDDRGCYRRNYMPGALTKRQFDAYLVLLSTGIGRTKARELALETPKR